MEMPVGFFCIEFRGVREFFESTTPRSLRAAQIMKVGASAGSESTVVGAIRATSIGTPVTVFVVLYFNLIDEIITIANL